MQASLETFLTYSMMMALVMRRKSLIPMVLAMCLISVSKEYLEKSLTLSGTEMMMLI
jgi:hypothetical protein|tara:strand:- start:221 stop:391 length:171 start_codon:yes stop_codon:yes gene_type:complete